MLQHDNPVASANYLADYVNANVSTFPEYLKPKALEAVREMSPVVRLVKGMELLLAVVLDEADTPEHETALNALGSVAMQVAEGGFWSKGDRALSIVKFVRHQLGEWPAGLTPPEAPTPDPEYAAPPAPIVPVAPAGEGDGEDQEAAPPPTPPADPG